MLSYWFNLSPAMKEDDDLSMFPHILPFKTSWPRPRPGGYDLMKYEFTLLKDVCAMYPGGSWKDF